MANTDSTTTDAGTGGWSGTWNVAEATGQMLPRLRLLYHVDPDRVGAVAALPRRGVVVGRKAPVFVHVDDPLARPLEDPTISRAQCRVQWDGDAFVVEPTPAGRRPIRCADTGADAPETISTSRRLPPGGRVAIGTRILLGLEVGRAPDPRADRLGLRGESEATWGVRDAITRIARFLRPVLVEGPTGSGKALACRALHAASGRRDGPFVVVPCPALDAAGAERALFGAATGASDDRDAGEGGYFRAAHRGTLVLDDLDELPAEVQPKLLRAIQGGQIRAVGANMETAVDVRVVACVRDGEHPIRAELYHRVSGHVLRMPSLAERPFDAPELFVRALRALRTSHRGLKWLWGLGWQPSMPIGFFDALVRHPWPGNVMELENFAERTAQLNLEPGPFRAPPALVGAPRPAATVAPEASLPRNVARAARALGVSRRSADRVFADADLGAVFGPAAPEPPSDHAVRALAADALYAQLVNHDFKRGALAEALGLSRTTLNKLLRLAGIPRASELDPAALEAACEAAGGDLSAAARALRIAPDALRRRLGVLRLERSGAE